MLRQTWHHHALRRARLQLASRDQDIVREQIAVSEIAAPTGEEDERARWVARRFEALRLCDVRIDEAGNVIGRRPGKTDAPPVVVCAHLDTVFPRQTRVSVTRQGNRLAGPGIGDNGRGVAAMLALATAVDGETLMTERPIDFIGTTGEEGAGDLRGAKHLFAHDGRDASAAVILDGAGDERIVHRALASRRYRLTFEGPGGHSWTAFGVPNAVHAAAVATARLARLILPTTPRTTLSVGRIGGGISVNSIPDRAWLEVDVRSASAAVIARLDREVREAGTAGAIEENARRALGHGGHAPHRQKPGAGHRLHGREHPDQPRHPGSGNRRRRARRGCAYAGRVVREYRGDAGAEPGAWRGGRRGGTERLGVRNQ